MNALIMLLYEKFTTNNSTAALNEGGNTQYPKVKSLVHLALQSRFIRVHTESSNALTVIFGLLQSVYVEAVEDHRRHSQTCWSSPSCVQTPRSASQLSSALLPASTASEENLQGLQTYAMGT